MLDEETVTLTSLAEETKSEIVGGVPSVAPTMSNAPSITYAKLFQIS